MALNFKCDCGCVFSEEECGNRRELVGEFWGVPAYQNFNCCPECGSEDFYELEEEEDEEEDTEEESWFLD